MALYDVYNSPEELLRPDRVGLQPQFAKPQDYAAQARGGGQLSPSFVGGEVDPTTKNLNPGTMQDVKRGKKVTPFSTPPAPTPQVSQAPAGFMQNLGDKLAKGVSGQAPTISSGTMQTLGDQLARSVSRPATPSSLLASVN